MLHFRSPNADNCVIVLITIVRVGKDTPPFLLDPCLRWHAHPASSNLDAEGWASGDRRRGVDMDNCTVPHARVGLGVSGTGVVRSRP